MRQFSRTVPWIELPLEVFQIDLLLSVAVGVFAIN